MSCGSEGRGGVQDSGDAILDLATDFRGGWCVSKSLNSLDLMCFLSVVDRCEFPLRLRGGVFRQIKSRGLCKLCMSRIRLGWLTLVI